jgi:magnesium-transporting ATPase (P-type)
VRCHFAIVFAQHLDNGHLTPLGWAVAVVYVLGALCCARAGRVTQQDGRRCSNKQQPWWVITAVLLFLGINKLLNLQTTLINLGRATAWTESWHQYQRVAQVVFVVLFTLALLAVFAAFLKKCRWFVKERPLPLAGVLILFLFVVIRVSTLNHVEALFHLNLYDNYWGWILELGGTACIAWSAAQIKAR